MGIPTATFVTKPFAPAAKAQAKLRGIPDLPIIVIPHDYTFESEQEKVERVGEAVDAVIAALVHDE